MTITHDPALDEVLDYPFNRPDTLGLAPEYETIREATGLARVRLPFGEEGWLATRYDDVRTVLADPRFSRAVAVQHDEPRMRDGRQTTGILSLDPPDHSRLRTLVSRAFTPRRVEALRPKAESICAGLVDSMRAEHTRTGAPIDLVEDFALPLPVQVICELLGVPTADRPRFRVWSDNALSTTGLSVEAYEASREEFREYMRDLLAQKRARRAAGESPDDLMCALLDARDGEDRLTELELVDLCNAILVAGHETTASQIPNFLLFLLGRPDEFGSLPVPEDAWRSLHDDPSLVPGVVEELMRLVPLGIGGGQARYATEDVELSGIVVRAGEPVLVSVAAANRDPEVFDRPDEFDPTRGRSGHIGFGHGAHHCLGAALARVELQEAIRALSAAFPDITVTDVEWKEQMAVRGPRHLSVTW